MANHPSAPAPSASGGQAEFSPYQHALSLNALMLVGSPVHPGYLAEVQAFLERNEPCELPHEPQAALAIMLSGNRMFGPELTAQQAQLFEEYLARGLIAVDRPCSFSRTPPESTDRDSDLFRMSLRFQESAAGRSPLRLAVCSAKSGRAVAGLVRHGLLERHDCLAELRTWLLQTNSISDLFAESPAHDVEAEMADVPDNESALVKFCALALSDAPGELAFVTEALMQRRIAAERARSSQRALPVSQQRSGSRARVRV